MKEPPMAEDPPMTPEEIADSHRRATAHLALVTAALAGRPKPPRVARPRLAQARSAHLRPARSGPAHAPSQAPVAERADRLMPSAAWLLAAICRRGSCRRAPRACR
ncbi:hypothetical protein VQ042_06820 [Aurantimonas sp. A2-1-M11]|uniref:hypothetical protein n=1 Tax=Aurantimonas sp. A2-1-M11 TaxID=3113712 RepID=UPI002F9324D9